LSIYTTKDGRELQSVTTITGACSDKSGLMKWYAKMTAEYIRKFCTKPKRGFYASGYEYLIDEDDLDDAIEHASEEGKRAMEIGSNVHSHIEEFLIARRTSI